MVSFSLCEGYPQNLSDSASSGLGGSSANAIEDGAQRNSTNTGNKDNISSLESRELKDWDLDHIPDKWHTYENGSWDPTNDRLTPAQMSELKNANESERTSLIEVEDPVLGTVKVEIREFREFGVFVGTNRTTQETEAFLVATDWQRGGGAIVFPKELTTTALDYANSVGVDLDAEIHTHPGVRSPTNPDDFNRATSIDAYVGRTLKHWVVTKQNRWYSY